MTRKARKSTDIYARAYVHMLRNKKLVARSHTAWRLYVSSWIRCREEGNDGEVDPGWLFDLLPGESRRVRGVLVPNGALDAAIDELVAVGLWDPEPHGWTVHDYLDHQDGSDTIAAARARGREAADARWAGAR